MARRRSSRWSDRGTFFPPSRPLAAPGGIKARSRKGAFAESWWARRWLESLESVLAGGRLDRGRRYARGGQVTELEVRGGAITARVQGSRPRPYEVEIRVKALGPAQQRRLANALAGEALASARLLAGEMPPELERTFADAGLPLFPGRPPDLVSSCSCPDWSNPCKHVAAVYYLVAEELDRDPFLLLPLRWTAFTPAP